MNALFNHGHASETVLCQQGAVQKNIQVSVATCLCDVVQESIQKYPKMAHLNIVLKERLRHFSTMSSYN